MYGLRYTAAGKQAEASKGSAKIGELWEKRSLAHVCAGTGDAGASIHLHYKPSELIPASLSHIKQKEFAAKARLAAATIQIKRRRKRENPSLYLARLSPGLL